jgi:hypothetical protein
VLCQDFGVYEKAGWSEHQYFDAPHPYTGESKTQKIDSEELALHSEVVFANKLKSTVEDNILGYCLSISAHTATETTVQIVIMLHM